MDIYIILINNIEKIKEQIMIYIKKMRNILIIKK